MATGVTTQFKVNNKYRPAEPVLLSTPIGLKSLGSTFEVEAPFTGCRLCGSIYQSKLDLLCRTYLEQGHLVETFDPITRTSTFYGDDFYLNVLHTANDKRARWRELHERRYHTEKEIESFNATGFAFTPEAANKLAPFGITPLGNLHPEIIDALYTAPRAPVNDVES